MVATNLLQTITPDHKCPIHDRRPAFAWRPARGQHLPRKPVTYSLRVVTLSPGEDAEKALTARRPILELTGIGKTSLDFPTRAKALTANQAYAYRVTAHDLSGQLVGNSNIGLFFIESGDLPFRLSDLLCCQSSLPKEGVAGWQIAYGSPQIQVDGKGCLEQSGRIVMSGSREHGDAIYQITNGPLSAGRRYAFRFCARLVAKELDHIQFKLLAFNGSLPTSGNHPMPSSDIQVIGETSPIRNDDWAYVLLPPWQAPRDFTGVAILATTAAAPDAGRGSGEIAGICLVEVSGDDCGQVVNVTTVNGKIVLEERLQQYADPDHEPQANPVDFSHGSVVDMIGDMFDADGNLSWYQGNDPCVSLGGELPPDAAETDEEAIDLGGGYTLEDIEKMTEPILSEIGKKPDLQRFKPIPPEEPQRCSPFRPDKKKPFGGRDIIFIHGFQPGHVIKQIARRYDLDTAGSSSVDEEIEARYPDANLTTGFYGEAAQSYWRYHIGRFLGDGEQPNNRYLIASFNSNQRLIENVHAILKQIRDAMNDGTNVVYHQDDRRQARCFGRDCVIVTHSTGALVADVALSLAAQSANVFWLREFLGDVAYIPRRVATHISLHGAISGSELGALAVVGANTLAAAAPGIDGAVDIGIADVNSAQTLGPQWLRDGLAGFNREVNTVLSLADTMTDNLLVYAGHAVTVVNNSILVDLAPLVAKLLWGEIIGATPVPTLTVAGGHPLDPTSLQTAAKIPLRGFDDGVVNTNSQSASPSLLHPDTFSYMPPAARIFDMGLHPARSLLYFADQYKGPGRAAFGSVPWLSPSGMVQPVDGTLGPAPRYGNHYPFIQSASDHMAPISPPTPPQGTHEYHRTAGQRNYEETLVIADSFVLASGLVNPAIANMVQAWVRGMDLVIRLRIPIPRFTLSPPAFTMDILRVTVILPLWRRRYHLLKSSTAGYPWNPVSNDLSGLGAFLANSEPRGECDFVYQFVLR